MFFRHEPGGVLHGSRVLPTEDEADKLADDLRSQINAKRRDISAAIDDYKADMELHGLAKRTISEHPSNIRRLLADVLDSPMATLTPRRADQLYQDAAKKVSAGTSKLWLANAKTWAEWCLHPRRRWLRSNPFADVEAIGAAADHRSEHLRIDEARKYRDKALELAEAGDHTATAALLPLLCGLIPSEIIQIRVRDIDDGGAVLWIAGKRLKTKNRLRSLAVDYDKLRALLIASVEGKQPDELVFASDRREGSVTRQYVTIVCQRIGKAAGVPVADALMLRRTFFTTWPRRCA